ncbi:MAG: sensor histidine kinase [Cognaticolwellia sp.]
MPTNKRVWSIRRIFLLYIIGFVTLTSITSIAIVTEQNTRGHQTVAEGHIKYWAKMIVDGSREFLVNSERQALSNSFANTQAIPKLNYLHIYQVNPQSQQAELFYSYKRNERRTAISEKISEMPDLLTPRFKGTFVEYMQVVKADDKIIGYVYLQNSTEDIAKIHSELLTLSIIMMLVVVLIAICVALHLERYINSPFNQLIDTIQRASRQKNFQQPCGNMAYREADMLARNINVLFTRMEKHIAQLNAKGQENIEHSQALENKINKRTQALKESNHELLSTLEKLHQFQGQLVESEKMASLGDMVAGVAHEVNTPIGLGVTASTLLSDRLAEVKQAFEDKTLKSSQLKKFLHEGNENVAIIYRYLNRAADLISSFKKVAVDQSSEEVRSFNVKQLLTEVLLTLRPQLQSLPYVIDIDCPDNLTITSKPGPINQILINLIMNSIIHGFENREKGLVSIAVMPLSNQLNILFKDDGCGVNESVKNKVFEPFTTTKRGEGGSGLGLHLVYNLVTQALGGTIVLNSELDQGVSIEINFPIN